ncbi:hypothetical protein [Bradyrhizobium cenepequi]
MRWFADKVRCWIAGKLIKLAMRMMDDETRAEVFRLLGVAARKGML